MPAFLANSDLSRGDLRLYLSNENGYSSNAFSVQWTVFSSAGIKVSGNSLQAINPAVGEYYAPWCAKAINGCYKIRWEIKEAPGCPPLIKEENFFVVEPSAYQCCPNFVCDNGQPEPGCSTFLVGAVLGPGDLPLFLKNSDGVRIDAFAVYWQIFDRNMCPVTQRTEASSGTCIGEYYAQWFVNVLGGEYLIKWEYMEFFDSPLESTSMRFATISPAALFFTYNSSCTSPHGPVLNALETATFSSCFIIPNYTVTSICYPCAGPSSYVPPSNSFVSTNIQYNMNNSCSGFEVIRVVHLSTQNLPIGGAFTNQPVYSIPSGIRTVTFYIIYSRGVAGGQAKYRILWGNGVEETQSTLINQDFDNLNTATSAQSMFLNDLIGPEPVDNNPVTSTLELSVPGGAVSVRLIASEIGDVGAPGVVGITLTAAS